MNVDRVSDFGDCMPVGFDVGGEIIPYVEEEISPLSWVGTMF